jgi:hypothetical protein
MPELVQCMMRNATSYISDEQTVLGLSKGWVLCFVPLRQEVVACTNFSAAIGPHNHPHSGCRRRGRDGRQNMQDSIFNLIFR